MKISIFITFSYDLRKFGDLHKNFLRSFENQAPGHLVKESSQCYFCLFVAVMTASAVACMQLLRAQKDSDHYTVYTTRRCFLWNNQYFQLDVYEEPCPPRYSTFTCFPVFVRGVARGGTWVDVLPPPPVTIGQFLSLLCWCSLGFPYSAPGPRWGLLSPDPLVCPP